MDAMRRLLRISRRDRMRNEMVRERVGIEGTITNDIERKQLIWYGHVQRMEEQKIPKQVLNWIPPVRRKKERPKKTWIEGIRKSMSKKNLTDNKWNRQEWKLGIGQRGKTL
ncbi:hypothetical protein ILUMI_24742 [Ignelater luminosus]|uniref:Endonuclease-reverse transcriptase n=1 Tax=Ignelater luminosus TaxID=2038154 RepID=A0A8K0C9Y8_IGNLU|nr:hypothetical protein ILUMI_24742 [Ignelater luminosus]